MCKIVQKKLLNLISERTFFCDSCDSCDGCFLCLVHVYVRTRMDEVIDFAVTAVTAVTKKSAFWGRLGLRSKAYLQRIIRASTADRKKVLTILFANVCFFLYLRTSALAFTYSRATSKSQFPRSYSHPMQPIL